jgi:hypothetical protein
MESDGGTCISSIINLLDATEHKIEEDTSVFILTDGEVGNIT